MLIGSGLLDYAQQSNTARAVMARDLDYDIYCHKIGDRYCGFELEVNDFKFENRFRGKDTDDNDFSGVVYSNKDASDTLITEFYQVVEEYCSECAMWVVAKRNAYYALIGAEWGITSRAKYCERDGSGGNCWLKAKQIFDSFPIHCPVDDAVCQERQASVYNQDGRVKLDYTTTPTLNGSRYECQNTWPSYPWSAHHFKNNTQYTNDDCKNEFCPGFLATASEHMGCCFGGHLRRTFNKRWSEKDSHGFKAKPSSAAIYFAVCTPEVTYDFAERCVPLTRRVFRTRFSGIDVEGATDAQLQDLADAFKRDLLERVGIPVSPDLLSITFESGADGVTAVVITVDLEDPAQSAELASRMIVADETVFQDVQQSTLVNKGAFSVDISSLYADGVLSGAVPIAISMAPVLLAALLALLLSNIGRILKYWVSA
jgi:hypothetical protein